MRPRENLEPVNIRTANARLATTAGRALRLVREIALVVAIVEALRVVGAA